MTQLILKKGFCFCFIALCFLGFHRSFAQTPIVVTPGSTTYLCQGTSYTIHLNLTAVNCGTDFTNSSSQFIWKEHGTGNLSTCCYDLNYNTFNITAFGDIYDTVTVNSICSHCGNCNGATFLLVFRTYLTSITSGPNLVCGNPPSNNTYTASSNLPSAGTTFWTFPSTFMSGTGQNGYTAYSTATGGGSGTISCVVTSSNACPSGNASNIGTLNVISSNGPPQAPTGTISYSVDYAACPGYGWNLSVTPTPGAVAYTWYSSNHQLPYGGFDFIDSYTSSPNAYLTDGGYGLTTNVTVAAVNGCGTGNLIARRLTLTGWSRQTCSKYGSRMAWVNPPEQEPIDDYLVYPNPANQSLTIQYPMLEGQAVEILIYDMLGNKVINHKFAGNENEINLDVSGIPAGIYFSVITSKETVLKKQKVIIQH